MTAQYLVGEYCNIFSGVFALVENEFSLFAQLSGCIRQIILPKSNILMYKEEYFRVTFLEYTFNNIFCDRHVISCGMQVQ